jgi:signal transduction histidine kinase
MKDRHIETAVPGDLPPVRAVRDHLAQVVLNLVLNALDATAKGGRIRIEARLEGDAIALDVADDGRGIGLADRCRLFQAFFTTKAQGTGLGLFISRQIVEELGGTLTYTKDLGRGTTFTVRLRAAPAALTASAATGEEAA